MKPVLVAASLCACVVVGIHIHRSILVLPSLNGPVVLNNAYLKALACSPSLQRLKHIDQSGPVTVFGFIPAFSRYDHSIGVWALLRKHRCSLSEQAAGLLHDASHTAFSHMADFLFAEEDNYQAFTENGYQDSVHMRTLEIQGVFDLAAEHKQDARELDPETPAYRCLEQPGPDLCADRIDYIVRTCVVMKMLSKKEGKAILDDLQFDGENWFFLTIECAKQFALASLYFTQNFWGAPWNVSVNIHFAKAIRRVMTLGGLCAEDLLKDDAFVLEHVKAYLDDPIVAQCWKQCQNGSSRMDGVEYTTVRFSPKFRGVNPLVRRNDGRLVRLTELDTLFRHAYEETKAWCKEGYEIPVLKA